MIRALTERLVRDLVQQARAETEGRPFYCWGKGDRGLGFRVNRDGSVVWVFKFKANGHALSGCLGDYPGMSLKSAREAFSPVRARAKEGICLNPKKYTPMPWNAVVARFAGEYVPNLKPSTQENYRSLVRVHLLPAFKGQMAHEITPEQVRDLHRQIGEKGKHRQANVVLRVLSVIFDRCEAWFCRELNSNPVLMLRKGGHKFYRENVRNRQLSDAELRAIGRALGVMAQRGFVQFASVVKALLFSGARLREVLGMRWEDIDLGGRTIRWADSKTGAITKPLSDALLGVLQEIPRIAGNPWVFPSARSKSGHLECVKGPWDIMLEVAGLEGIHRHDLRHNLGNIAADAGLNLQTIACLLGHKQVSTTERYSKVRSHPGLLASNQVSDLVRRLVEGA